ncbi:MAG: hypothetical protein H8E51_07010 [Bacteroidetes bacterium]|nr:hypothetical protein [Bacteroidota bacterium]
MPKKTKKSEPFPPVIFSDCPVEEREELLSANAYAVEVETYSKPLTEEQVEQANAEYAKLSIEITAKEEELAALKLQYSTQLKPARARQKMMLVTIRTGQFSMTDKVYRMADHANNNMHLYDKEGNKLSTRRLMPNEMQTTLQSHE